MSRLKRNVVANFTANVWSALMSLLFVPLYIRYLGIESWGLIGLFATLQAIFGLADMGLSTTLNRELARSSVNGTANQDRRDLLRTVEALYWGVSLIAGAVIIIGAPIFAVKWLHVQHLSIDLVRRSIMLMGAVIALQLPLGLYSGGLIGLQHQVLLNAINIAAWTLRSAGAVAVLAFVSPTVTAYFWWQVMLSIAQTAIVAVALWRSVGPSPERPRFRRVQLQGIWRFSAGMVGIVAVSTLLTQIDKLIVSRVVTLESFGYYSLAAAVAASLYRLVTPLYTSFFPRLTELLAVHDAEGVTSVYHSGSQLACVVLAPVTVVVALFSREALFVWTHNAVTADRSYLLLTLLAIGTGLNGVMIMPYAMQLAHGWTRLTLRINVIACMVYAPLLLIGLFLRGPAGAAAAWPVLNAGLVIFMIELMHRRILPGEKMRWLIEDIGRPAVASVTVALLGRLLFPVDAGRILAFACLGVILLATFAAAVLSAPATRQMSLIMFERFIGRNFVASRAAK